jgi:hypothetical protein
LESLETVSGLEILKFFYVDPGFGIRNLFDPGSRMEKFGSGIYIPDPQHWMQRFRATRIVSH